MDHPTVNTELQSSTMVTATVTGSGGFTGDVAVTAKAVDSTGATIADWTVTLDKATATITSDGGSAQVVATVKIPSVSTMLTGSIKFDATATGVTAQSTHSDFTTAKQITYTMTLNNNQCVYPNAAVGPVQVQNGTKLRFVNGATAGNIRIHSDGKLGIAHQAADMGPGMAYEQTVSATSGTDGWYCHTPGNNPNNLSFQAVP